MKNHRAVEQQGFTLVELLVALLIGVLVITGCVGLFSSLLKTYQKVNNLAIKQEQLTFTIESITRNIRNAEWRFEADSSVFDPPKSLCRDADDNEQLSETKENKELELYINKDRIEQALGGCDHYQYRLEAINGSYTLMEEFNNEGSVELLGGLKEDGFRVCQGADIDNQQQFKLAFCFDDAACNHAPSCNTDLNHPDWQGWVRFYVTSRNLAILQILYTQENE